MQHGIMCFSLSVSISSSHENSKAPCKTFSYEYSYVHELGNLCELYPSCLRRKGVIDWRELKIGWNWPRIAMLHFAHRYLATQSRKLSRSCCCSRSNSSSSSSDSRTFRLSRPRSMADESNRIRGNHSLITAIGKCCENDRRQQRRCICTSFAIRA